jgi:prefoldin subunit 5
MKTKTQINTELEQATSRINFLQAEIGKHSAELQTLAARQTELQTELQTAPEGESAGKTYIDRTYRRKDEKSKK